MRFPVVGAFCSVFNVIRVKAYCCSSFICTVAWCLMVGHLTLWIFGLLAFSAIHNAVLNFGKGLGVRFCQGCVAKSGIAGFGTSLFNSYPLIFQSSWTRLQPSYPLVMVCGKYTTQYDTARQEQEFPHYPACQERGLSTRKACCLESA